MFRLALALGRTVAELEYVLLAGELAEWVAFASLEPFGYDMDNFRAGLVASTIANQHRKEGADPVLPMDWFGKSKAEQEQEKQTPEQIAANIKAKVFGIRG